MAVDPSNDASGPVLVVDPSILITPTQTPNQTSEGHKETATEEEGAWKVMTRKTKDKGKQVAFQTVRMVQYSTGQDSGRSWGAKGPNHYLS